MRTLSQHLKLIITPFLNNKGFKIQKKETSTIWTYVKVHEKRDQIIQISQSNYDKNSIRFYAYVEGLNEEKMGGKFIYYKNEEELENILKNFISIFETNVFPYLDQKSNEIVYGPSLKLAKKLLVSYKNIAQEFINMYNLNLDNGEEIIDFLQDFLYIKKKQSELPTEANMESVCATLMSLLEYYYEFELTLDEYTKSPFLKKIGDNEEVFLFPLNLVYTYWNKMDNNEDLLMNVWNDINQRSGIKRIDE
ncbi:hypothetical protein CDO73_02590 [Saccharibacillus sp. O23]|uniref:hypothetical protein n=1 Tax=Saccharibacillus sp. O23 TaxID=2009338 RepID=UPI000B4E2E76|nr:hypothetical protein [Saccharibacillus sp. O23]OWR32510.1 hypothetical protein CDO73_02590 [Saccharibacillus sp. O23]